MAGELVRGEDDDLRGDVLGLRDLAQRHRARDPRAPGLGSTWPRVIGDSVQPGATAFTRAARRDPHDLVLQPEQQAARDRRLRGRVVGVPGLAEDARSRADEDERAVPVPLDLAEERRAR